MENYKQQIKRLKRKESISRLLTYAHIAAVGLSIGMMAANFASGHPYWGAMWIGIGTWNGCYIPKDIKDFKNCSNQISELEKKLEE